MNGFLGRVLPSPRGAVRRKGNSRFLSRLAVRALNLEWLGLGRNRKPTPAFECSQSRFHSRKPAVPDRCLIDLSIGLPLPVANGCLRGHRTAWMPGVRAFMIAAGRFGVDVSVSDTRFGPRRSGRDRPGMAARDEVCWTQAQRNSVSFSQSE